MSDSKGEWLSLVEHLVRDQGVGGSNPLSPTIKSRNFNSFAKTLIPAIPELGSIWVQQENSRIQAAFRPPPLASAHRQEPTQYTSRA
jgi:hypothetical protein